VSDVIDFRVQIRHAKDGAPIIHVVAEGDVSFVYATATQDLIAEALGGTCKVVYCGPARIHS